MSLEESLTIAQRNSSVGVSLDAKIIYETGGPVGCDELFKFFPDDPITSVSIGQGEDQRQMRLPQSREHFSNLSFSFARIRECRISYKPGLFA